MVAGRLVVECTSFEYHASPQQYRLDRDRIAAVVRLGFGVLELTYHQVLFAWDEVLETIEAALAFATAGRTAGRRHFMRIGGGPSENLLHWRDD
ncbi:hypothetical protein [Frondihabitans peucedani]|uniref:Xylose isomerase-like TIM barrel protein n=1 Tax=Frondihabitans peucedani TaxID=598626 RepID=A0ABP8E058_9MICO